MHHEGKLSREDSKTRGQSALGAALFVLRHTLYMALMLVRVPLRLISHLAILPLVGLGMFWGLAAGWSSPACLWMIGSAIALFVVGFLFDTLLLWVSPEALYLES